MSLSTQQIIDVSGAGLFSVAALVFAGLSLVNTFMDPCPQKKTASVRIKLLSHAATIALIQAFAYWAAFGGYGAFTRPGDGVTIQWALILTWPFSWYYVGKALGTYLLHSYYWKHCAAKALMFAGLAHYLGAYIDTTTPLNQTVAFVLGLLSTLAAVYIAVVLRRRRDTNALITIVVAVLGVVAGFYLSYLLAEYFLGVVTGIGFSVWLLVANIVVYIAFMVWLLFTARDPAPKRGD